MRLALDAMGGDHAPAAMVSGSVDYARAHPDHEIILVGQQERLEQALGDCSGARPDNLRLHHASEVIGMADKISALKDHPDDSMNVACRLVKAGEADAVVLCGNTACSVAAAQLHLRRIPGVKRAGILTPLPTLHNPTWVIDCGANAVGKAEHLAQFAMLAAAFLECYQATERPRVGVLNIGSEEEKGDELTAQTLALIKQTDLHSIGYVEGNDLFTGNVDVAVCDGFTGNVVLKTSEGVAKAITEILKQEIHLGLRTKVGALLMKPAFHGLRRRTHWSLVGGCLLLGVDGITVIGHGRSDATAVASALAQAARCVERDLMTRLRSCLSQHRAPVAEAARDSA